MGMKKLVAKAGHMIVEEVPAPRVIEPLDAIVKVTSALISSEDIRKTRMSQDRLTGVGKAACGEIIEVGSEVNSFHVGDAVVVNSFMPCFICNDCQRGHASDCASGHGGNELGGTISENLFINNAEANLTIRPESSSEENACYAPYLLSKGMFAVEECKLPIGATLAVSGLGPTGLMAIASARLNCVGYLIAIVDKDQHEKRYAKEFGADMSLAIGDDVIGKIQDVTNGAGVDGSIECGGSLAALKQCIDITRTGGTVIKMNSNYSDENVNSTRDLLSCLNSNVTIREVKCPVGGERIERMMRLIDTGRIDPVMLTTHQCKFDDIESSINQLIDGNELVESILVDVR